MTDREQIETAIAEVLAEHRLDRGHRSDVPVICVCGWTPVVNSYLPAAVAEHGRHQAERIAERFGIEGPIGTMTHSVILPFVDDPSGPGEYGLYRVRGLES